MNHLPGGMGFFPNVLEVFTHQQPAAVNIAL
jgi:hypothetical protein